MRFNVWVMIVLVASVLCMPVVIFAADTGVPGFLAKIPWLGELLSGLITGGGIAVFIIPTVLRIGKAAIHAKEKTIAFYGKWFSRIQDVIRQMGPEFKQDLRGLIVAWDALLELIAKFASRVGAKNVAGFLQDLLSPDMLTGVSDEEDGERLLGVRNRLLAKRPDDPLLNFRFDSKSK